MSRNQAAGGLSARQLPLLLCLFLLSLPGVSVVAQNATTAGVKRALLIGINDYKSVPGLQGSVNDVETMREVLLKRWGFPAANIKVLTDAAATREGILAALDELVRTAGPDDTVYFHYSGHGSQVDDQNGDEADGLDETIVPVDGRSPGVADILDDQLDAIFARLKARNAVIVLDSCHSGTATRSFDIRARSIPRDTRRELYKPTGVQTRALVPVMSSHFVVLSAAASTEEALDGPVDGRYHGFFTYALARSMGASAPGASPRSVFGGVARELTRLQSQFGRTSMPEPQLEATNTLIDQPMFGIARAEPASSRVAWLDVQPIGAAEVLLIRGAALGAGPGSNWAIYAPGETAFVPGRALATATVTQLRGADAVARLQGRTPTIETNARAIAMMPARAAGKIAIGLLNIPAARRNEIAAVLSRDIRNVSLVESNAPAQFLVDMQGDSVRLLTAAGQQLVGSFPVASNRWGADMARAVARMGNAAELLSLDNPAAQLRVTVRVAGRPAFATRGIAVVADTQATSLHIRRADEARAAQNSLQVEVEVSADAYITIADVDSEGGVNLLFPNSYQQRSFYGDGALRGGAPVLIPDSLQAGNRAGFYWDYSPPRGLDTLRIFASTDLATANVIRQRVTAMQGQAAGAGSAARSIAAEIGQLREDLTQLATRDIRLAADASAPPDWAAASLNVQISE